MSVLGPVGREALEQVTCEPGADPVRSLQPKHVGLSQKIIVALDDYARNVFVYLN